MLVLGFTNVYYTLWSVIKTTRSFMGATYEDTTFRYHQNLSFDFAEAQKKIAKLSDGFYEVDLDLRGEEGHFFTHSRVIKSAPDWMFSFGKLAGLDMRESTDAWQLERAMREEPVKRRRVYARRRLIELGELVRKDWFEKVPTNYDAYEDTQEAYRKVPRKWMPKRLAKYYEEVGDKKGLFYTDKQRLDLQVRPIRVKSWDATDFSGRHEITMYRISMVTPEGYLVEYKGANPPKEIVQVSEVFIPIKATVKHNVYGDLKQTFLQRIKA